ncbi:MAG: PEP-CTERM sorting domain-containing protein [Scytonema sp. PMC 1070.18]|nr:PEP-CTERM sorting domain-containing protein [Scytonema sp. PMC 1070.18]
MKMKFLCLVTTFTTLTGMFVTPGRANAALLEYFAEYKPPVDEVAPYDGYGFTDIIKAPLNIQKFDSALGTLQSVKIDFLGNLKGDASFESRNTQSSNVTVDLSGLLKLELPDNTSVFEVSPQQEYSYEVAKYDGKLDFDGTSGKTIAGLVATLSDTKTYTDSNELNSFTGLDNLEFLFTAKAESTVSGSGNIASYVTTYASSSVRITYEYEKRRRVPEPSALIGVGLVAAMGFLSKRRLTANS